MKNNSKKSGISLIGKGLTRNEMKNISGGDVVVPPGGGKGLVCSYTCSPCTGSGFNCKHDGVCC